VQNLNYRVPGLYVHRYLHANGVEDNFDTASSTRFIIQAVTGSRGRRPKSEPKPINPYNYNNQDVQLEISGDVTYANGDRDMYHGPILSTTVQGSSADDPYDYSMLYNQALDKLNDKSRGDLDISIDFAEWHQTAKMVNASEQFTGMMKTAFGRFGPVKLASNLWLQYTYGVKPLLSDIYGAADESIRVVLNKIERHHARATTVYTPKTVTFHTIFGAQNVKVLGGKMKRSVTLGVDLTTKEWDPARWSSLNPVSIAWELMPYSFVVDWFLNVGGYLRNMETSLLYANRFRTGYYSRLAAWDLQCQETKPVDSGTQLWRGYFKGNGFDRQVLLSYPAPTLPSFKAQLGSSRLLSAASLLANLLEGGTKRPRRDRGLERAVQSTSRSYGAPKQAQPAWPKGYWHL